MRDPPKIGGFPFALGNPIVYTEQVMNYLAHAYLADIDDDFMLGSFIGDFVKGNLSSRFSHAINAGIAFHRKIDRFADAHAKTRSSRNLFAQERRRYAGIVLDICYDHFLARHWRRYAECPLPEFIARMYALLDAREAILPRRLQAVIPRMRSENWLACYESLDGVRVTLKRISRRLSKRAALDDAMVDIHKNYGQMEKNFSIFFQDLIEYADTCIPARVHSRS